MVSNDQSMHSEQTYQYRPLRPKKEEIRLIRIEDYDSQIPASDDRNTICCSLQHAYLQESPRYTALSYTWGDPTIKADIILDGQRIQVTKNLELALRNLLLEQRSIGGNDSKLFWVDAVCIDQHSEAERSHQVSQMGKIFNTAAETIIWLGSSSEDSDLAFESLSELSMASIAVQVRGNINSWSLFPFDEAATSPSARAVLAELDTILADLKRNNSTKLAAVISLYERPWFRRVWVIQERVLSRNCVIYCGTSGRMAWRDFIRAFWLLCGLRDYLNIASTVHHGQDSSKLATNITAALDRVVPVVFTSYGLSLLQLLSMLSRSAPRSGLEASDRRDYIYSLLGLINTRSSPTIKVDYSQEWTAVRTELGRAALVHYGPYMLSFAATSPLGSEASEVQEADEAPSWAPDWSSSHLPQPLYVPSIFFVRGGNVGCPYQAARNSTQDLSRGFSRHGQLDLSAFYVDHVACLGQPLIGDDYPTDDLDRVASLSKWLCEMDTLLPSVNDVYSTSEQVQDALWKTPVVDRAYVYAWETARASEKTYSSYQAVRAGNVAEGVKYTNIAYNKLFQRRPFRSVKGYIGLGPSGMCEKDTIWILPGTDVPFVFRSAGNGKFTVIGEAYVHSIMHGELLEHGLDEQYITLI